LKLEPTAYDSSALTATLLMVVAKLRESVIPILQTYAKKDRA